MLTRRRKGSSSIDASGAVEECDCCTSWTIPFHRRAERHEMRKQTKHKGLLVICFKELLGHFMIHTKAHNQLFTSLELTRHQKLGISTRSKFQAHSYDTSETSAKFFHFGTRIHRTCFYFRFPHVPVIVPHLETIVRNIASDFIFCEAYRRQLIHSTYRVRGEARHHKLRVRIVFHSVVSGDRWIRWQVFLRNCRKQKKLPRSSLPHSKRPTA